MPSLRWSQIAAAVALAAAVGGGILLARTAAMVPTTSDMAVIEGATHAAARGTLLVGPYSRFQWHHPGPLYFYLLAPFYALSGDRPSGLAAGAFALNLSCVLLIGGWLRQGAGIRLAGLAAATFALYAWRAADAFASPWNPHIVVLPFAALVVGATRTLAGGNGALVLVALLASLTAQSHVALLPASVALGSAAFAATAMRAAREADTIRRHARLALAGTAATLALVWTPVVIEQFTEPTGNLTLLWRFFVSQHGKGLPLAVAVSAWSDMFIGVLRPDFYVAHGWKFVESPVRWAESLSLLLLLGLGWVALRRSGYERWLAGVLLVVSAIALWSATRAEETMFDHTVFWIAGLGVLTLSLLAGEAIATVAPGAPAGAAFRGFVVLGLAAVGLCGVTGLMEVGRGARASLAPPADAVAAGALGHDLLAFIHARQVTRPLIRIDQDAWEVAAGAIVFLQKQGVAVAVEDDWLPMFGPAFRVTGREPVIGISRPAEHLRLTGQSGWHTVSQHPPFYADTPVP